MVWGSAHAWVVGASPHRGYQRFCSHAQLCLCWFRCLQGRLHTPHHLALDAPGTLFHMTVTWRTKHPHLHRNKGDNATKFITFTRKNDSAVSACSLGER